MPYEHIMDEKRANETMRILTYDEAKTGVAAEIGVPVDDWEKSFGKYVEDQNQQQIVYQGKYPLQRVASFKVVESVRGQGHFSWAPKSAGCPCNKRSSDAGNGRAKKSIAAGK